MRRLWWRALDRICYCVVLIRLLIHDRIYEPEPITPGELQRQEDHERLISAFPAAGEAIDMVRLASFYDSRFAGRLGVSLRRSSSRLRKKSLSVAICRALKRDYSLLSCRGMGH